MRCFEIYKDKYQIEPTDSVFAPYRICPIGAHSDHNLGKITGFAIDKGITLVYGINEKAAINIESLEFNTACQWSLNNIPTSKVNDWADYLRGASLLLKNKYNIQRGLNGVIEGSLPIGGLSSSAAVTVAFIVALARANNIVLTKQELIDLAYTAEHDYVGVSIGKMDPACVVLCEKDKLLHYDTKDGSYQLIKPTKKIEYDILVFFSGLEHSLISSGFNNRVNELKTAAKELLGLAGIQKDGEIVCRYVSLDIYNQYIDFLPEISKLRAKHWFSEFQRVNQGVEAFAQGNLKRFGELSFASGYSSIRYWQAGAEQQIYLYELMKKEEGIYGGRFSGGGFKGSCICLSKPEYRDTIIKNISKAYLTKYPELRGKYQTYVCHSNDGVKL